FAGSSAVWTHPIVTGTVTGECPLGGRDRHHAAGARWRLDRARPAQGEADRRRRWAPDKDEPALSAAVPAARRAACVGRAGQRWADRSRASAAIASGPTRQQPPIIRAPSSYQRAARAAENRWGPTQARFRGSQPSPLFG